VQIACQNCGSRFSDLPGDLRHYRCSVCGSERLIRIQTEEERNRDALFGLAAGAAVGAAIGELPGAIIGGLIGLFLGASRMSRVEQQK